MRGEFTKEYFTPVDIASRPCTFGLHLVDSLIWIYLFPLLYLID